MIPNPVLALKATKLKVNIGKSQEATLSIQVVPQGHLQRLGVDRLRVWCLFKVSCQIRLQKCEYEYAFYCNIDSFRIKRDVDPGLI